MASGLTDNITSFAMWNSTRGVYLSPTVSSDEAATFGELVGSMENQPLVIQCSGVRHVASAFSVAYCRHHQPTAQFHLKKDLLLYVLETVQTPTHVTGRMRQGTAEDMPFLKDWASQFFAFIGAPLVDASGFMARALPTIFIWDDEAGTPVAFAGYAPPVQVDETIVYRIGPVFVPEHERRKGYASALTAALSLHVLTKDENVTARVCLYADAANPASNKAYQNVGYVPVSETSEFEFEAMESDDAK
ncbi:Aste57867_22903 [Aphanomyces stellatus]|nr:hypothetical protein As57867_022832 [Aphanomyces stellatus]KAF0701568.1 hypothetical protein As57867_007965 [Aphanomyces stellatus]VFT84888.1 Aste57867_7995 [Aphanomyces stellatus]VFT99553.1 Aste57867_22903 [Aphanomyces stellatus]